MPPIDPQSEAALIAAFVARRPGALEGAYRAYGRTLFSVARHVLGGDADAEDCVHDVLLRVWQRHDSFRAERGSLRGFLAACVRNEAAGRMRNAARHLAIEQRAFGSREESYEFEIDDPADRERVRAALAALPDDQRRAIELAYWRHLSQTQIAQTLGVPLGTIKSRISLGLRKLGASLGARERASS